MEPNTTRLKAGKELTAYREHLLIKQKYKCALCGEPIEEGDRVHVDHSHYKPTGHIRGALHAGCNVMEGKITNAKILNRKIGRASCRERV